MPLIGWVEANSSGRIIPHEGVDAEYDTACKKIEDIESNLEKHIIEQRKVIGDKSIKYVIVGKDKYLLEMSESLSRSVPRDYELRSSKKGFCRYWSPYIKKMVGELAQAEAVKEAHLKGILQDLIERFCKHHTMWRRLVTVVAELDALISLVIASDYYEGPTCRPSVSKASNGSDVPPLIAESLGHPLLKSDSLSRGTFVPNDVNIGGPDHATFVLLTGPNMGGKSTLIRQICLAVILAQVGADVPAQHFKLSLVDRIFVRMGAKDHIMAGQTTFLTELSETASMLFRWSRRSDALDYVGFMVNLRGQSPQCKVCGEEASFTSEEFKEFDYEKFTQTPLSTAPPKLELISEDSRISCKEYNEKVTSGEAHVLIDVRPPHHYDIIALPNSLNIPLSSLESQMPEISAALKKEEARKGASHAQLYTVCRRGNDSQRAVQALHNMGFTFAKDIVGGITSWAQEVDPNFPAY